MSSTRLGSPERGERTHLPAHGAVDGDDDETLDRVKDSKEDLEETKEICCKYCFQYLLYYRAEMTQYSLEKMKWE